MMQAEHPSGAPTDVLQGGQEPSSERNRAASMAIFI
jgi:hypothetical protein